MQIEKDRNTLVHMTAQILSTKFHLKTIDHTETIEEARHYGIESENNSIDIKKTPLLCTYLYVYLFKSMVLLVRLSFKMLCLYAFIRFSQKFIIKNWLIIDI